MVSTILLPRAHFTNLIYPVHGVVLYLFCFYFLKPVYCPVKSLSLARREEIYFDMQMNKNNQKKKKNI